MLELDRLGRESRRLRLEQELFIPPLAITGPLAQQVTLAAREASASQRLDQAIAAGSRDVNALTSAYFHARHPELGGRKLSANETDLAQEWRDIRDEIVAARLKRVGRKPGEVSDSHFVASPYTSSRGRHTVEAVILHFTAGGGVHENTVRYFQHNDRNVSAHFVIGRDGYVVQMVPLKLAAHHAGSETSRLLGARNVNARSVGIELVNGGHLMRRGQKYDKGTKTCMHDLCMPSGAAYTRDSVIHAEKRVWEPFEEAQYAALERVLRELAATYPDMRIITGHQHVDPKRRSDPGAAFDWLRIRRALAGRFAGIIGAEDGSTPSAVPARTPHGKARGGAPSSGGSSVSSPVPARPMPTTLPSASAGGAATAVSVLPNPQTVTFRPTQKKKGWAVYGGDQVTPVLRGLRSRGLLTLADPDIEVLQRASYVESGGKINAVQSYDSAYLSFGFMQWTIKYGELQDLIAKVPAAFRRYGIEIGGSYYVGKKNRPGIAGASKADELRAKAWVERFYRAGYDTDIVVAQANKANAMERVIAARAQKALGSSYNPSLRTPLMRAFVYEAYNNRPAYLWKALEKLRSRISSVSPSTQVFDLLLEELVAAHPSDEKHKPRNIAEKIQRTT